MNRKERLRLTEEVLRQRGLDADAAKEAAKESVAEGEPLLEQMCFETLALLFLAKIHAASWIKQRAKEPECEGDEVIKRLLDSGASAKDLAMFARFMQREYMSNLGCILDGSGIFGTPKLPFEEFRIFSVDDAGKPQAEITALHEWLEFSDWKTEMKQSREAEATFKASFKAAYEE